MDYTQQKKGRATLKDIAKQAGVSVSTASLVLAGKGSERRISANVEKLVREAALQQDYAPNLLVRSIQRGRTHVLCLYNSFQNLERNDIYMDRISSAIERAAGRLHYDVLIHCDFERPVEDIYRALNGGRTDGLIFFGPKDDDPLLELLRNSRLPTVMLNHMDERGVISSVCDDMENGMRLLAAEFIRLGHTRIAAISGSQHTDALPRINILREELSAKGVHLPEAWIIPVKHYEAERAEEVLKMLLAEPDPPTAIFCWHDRLGYLFLEACDRLNILVPQQLSFVGYDCIHWPSTSRHILSSIDVDVDNLAEAAVYLLDEIIQGKLDRPIEQIFPVKLFNGDTLAAYIVREDAEYASTINTGNQYY